MVVMTSMRTSPKRPGCAAEQISSVGSFVSAEFYEQLSSSALIAHACVSAAAQA